MQVKRNLLKVQILVLMGLLFSYQSDGAHIIGGDMTYQCLSIDSINMSSTFRIIVTMYRDSEGGGANFDDPARFGLFEGSGQNWVFIDPQFRIRPQTIQNLTMVDDPCVTIPPGIGVQSGLYSFEVTVPWSDQNYKVAYQRCCRNNTITNLVSPESTGAVFEIDITPEAQRSCNNSPVFNSFPPIVLCVNNPIELDLSASDSEADQVLYEFCTPKASGGQNPGTGCDAIIPRPADCLPPFGQVTFALPNYSVNTPLGFGSNISLDPVTGILKLTPDLLGQFVVGVCIKEFRNGRLLSEVTRDFQFNVAACEALVDANVTTDADGTSIDQEDELLLIKSCFNKRIEFENNSTIVFGDPVFKWEFETSSGLLINNNKDAVINFPDVGVFDGRMVINPDAGCSDTAAIQVIIYPETKADFAYDYDTCVAGPVEFYDQSVVGEGANIVEWSWLLNPDDSTNTQNPIFNYRVPGIKTVELIIEDSNECFDTINQEIRWIPVPDVIVVEPSVFVGCAPANIFFNNLSYPIDSTYTINWTFGDGGTDTIISPSHIYEEPGVFDVRLEVLSPEGCDISRDYPKLIEVSPAPEADFTFSPDFATSFEPDVQFMNTSQYVAGSVWTIGAEGLSFEDSPYYSFPDTGLVDVTLIGFHPLGCSDTITKQIDIKPISTLFTPNAFTPNNDGLNDVFIPEGIFLGIRDYSLRVWNRWGEMIYESDIIDEGWNGEMSNTGELQPQGVYVYQLQYTEPRGKVVDKKGHITLVR